jgi:hypothetical protein
MSLGDSINRIMHRLSRIIISAALLTVGFESLAQHQEISEKPLVYKGLADSAVRASTLLGAFKSGKVNGHFRYFFMQTNNEKNLSDYHAHALGGGLRFESGSFHGFQVAVSGFYTFNMLSSDLGLADSVTGQISRYELSLFDIENPGQKKDLDRLEEFYIKYNFRKARFLFGRQLINTPFINLQDGRMRPTTVKGLWGEGLLSPRTQFEGGWIYDISPRGTMSWYDLGESIGLYSTGVNTDGTKSGYAGQLSSAGVAVAGLTHHPNKEFKFQLWNYFTENIFNVAFAQLEYKQVGNKRSGMIAGLQLVRQDAVSKGGNDEPRKTYINKGHVSHVISTRLGWRNGKTETDVNYTRITSDGRFLMPREWGRDPFYTFLARERNEGLGNVHAWTARLTQFFYQSAGKVSLQLGYYDLPHVNDYRLNKYGMPSYWQANMDIRYRFGKVLDGFEAQWLSVFKWRSGDESLTSKYIINKVNLSHHNLVLNFYF